MTTTGSDGKTYTCPDRTYEYVQTMRMQRNRDLRNKNLRRKQQMAALSKTDRPQNDEADVHSSSSAATHPKTTTTTDDPKSDDNPEDETVQRPPYSAYIADMYVSANFGGQLPPVTNDPNGLEQKAREVMNPNGFGYIYGSAGEQATADANRRAFRQLRIVPRMLRPTTPRDLRVELFGKTYDCPIMMAPVGVMNAYHKDAESGVASACASLGVPFICSTAASQTLEDVAAAGDRAWAESGFGGAATHPPRWFQLYWPRDDEITASILSRAKTAGYDVLVVTLDTHSIGFRPVDLDAGFLPFLQGDGCAIGFSDPVFRRKFSARNDGASVDDPDYRVQAARYWLDEVFSGNAHSWDDLRKLRSMWGGPILLKGVQSPEDAVLARQYGMDGVIVSNHGGRQLDGAVASLEMLPRVIKRVNNNNGFPVLFDSGIRTGADVIKALALGARAVLVGRPVVYGLGIKGTEGAQHVLAALLAEVDQSMGLAGFQTIRELDSNILLEVQRAMI